MKKVFCFCFFSKCHMVQLLWVRFEHHEMLNVTVREITVQNNRLLPFPLSCNVTQIWFNLMGLGKMLDGRFWESTYRIRINVRKTVTARSLHINSVFVLVADTHLCLIVTRAGLVIGHTGHFPGGPTHWRGRQISFFFFFAKDHHAGTTSSQWPIGLSPALTA